MDEAPACVHQGFCLSADRLCQPSFEICAPRPWARGRTSNRDAMRRLILRKNSSTFVLYHSVISVINNKRAGICDNRDNPALFRRLALLSPYP